MEEMICTLDNTGVIQYVSTALLRRVGKSDYQTGTNVAEVIHPDDFDIVRTKFIQTIKNVVKFEAEIRLISESGNWIPIKVRAVPLLDNEEKVQTILIYTFFDPPLCEAVENHDISNQYTNVNVILWTRNLETGENAIIGNCKSVFGFTEAEFLANPFVWRRYIHPDDTFKINQADKEISLNQIATVEFRAIHPDGKIKWINSKITPTIDPFGNTKRVDGIAIEIPEKKTAKEPKGSIFYREYDQELIVTLNAHGIITNYSSNGFMGHFQEGLENKSFFQLFDSDQHLLLHHHFHAALEGSHTIFSTSFKTKMGIWLKLRICIEPLVVSGEVNSLLCRINYRNIYREIKERLQHNENTVRRLVAPSCIGLWHLHIENNSLIVTKGIEKITGFSYKNFMEDTRLWLKGILPEDTVLLKKNDHVIFSGSPIRHQYRIQNKSGEIRWVDERVFPTMDANGRMEYLEGIVLDITAEKEKHALESLNILSIESSKTSFATVDRDGMFTSVSQSATEITGYSAQELKSLSFKDLLPAESIPEVERYFINAIHGLDIQNRLITMIQKNGSRIQLHVIGLPFLQAGQIAGLYLISTDLSQHLHLEKNLLQSKQAFYQSYNRVNLGILLSEFKTDSSNCKILEANDYICGLLNYSYKEMLSKSFDDFALSHHNPARAFLKAGGEYFHYRSVILDKNGRKIPVYLYNHLTKWDHQSVILTLIQTISEKTKAAPLLPDSGQQLRILMAEMNINTAELAHMTKLTPATISNLRTGKVKKPNIETAKNISDALGVPISQIWIDVDY